MSLLRGRVADMGSFAHLFGGARASTPKAEDPAPADAAPEGEEAEEAKDGEDKPTDAPKAEGEGEMPDCEEGEGETPAQARAAERARCAAIFAAPAAAQNTALAAHLAFETDLTAEQAIGALALGGKAGSGLASRMAHAPNPSLGTGGTPKPHADSADALAAQITSSARIARGGKA